MKILQSSFGVMGSHNAHTTMEVGDLIQKLVCGIGQLHDTRRNDSTKRPINVNNVEDRNKIESPHRKKKKELRKDQKQKKKKKKIKKILERNENLQIIYPHQEIAAKFLFVES